MSDKDLIIGLLEAAERRIRRNRNLQSAITLLALALVFPVVLKLIDLFFPLRGIIVAIVLGLWALATLVWIVMRMRGRDTLEKTAASVDQTAGAHDQLRTAYWFIRNPKESPWVETQIQKAAHNAGKIRVASLYPRRFPRESFIAMGLVILLGFLNYIPLTSNWFQLKGAPAFTLNNAQKAELERALELLKKAEALHQTELAEKLAKIVDALKDGSMSQNQLSRSLSELQQQLAESNLNAGQITDGLERIAKALDPSALTKPVASSLFVLDLKDAAEQVRKLESTLDKASPSALQEMAQRFQDASNVAGPQLQQLAKYMSTAATAMNQRDTAAGQQALEQTAKEFERLQGVLDSLRLQNQASAQLDALQDSVGGTPGEVGEGQGEGQGQGQGEGQGVGQGEGQGQGQGEGQGKGQGQGEGEGEGQGEGEGDGDTPGRGGGRGGKQAGTSGPLPLRGEATELDVQFDKEALPIKATRGSRPETIEEASQRERSKLDYSKVPSELSKTQKDLLNQDSVPLEQRQLLKQYFETIRR
jgi:hypothetical protein